MTTQVSAPDAAEPKSPQPAVVEQTSATIATPSPLRTPGALLLALGAIGLGVTGLNALFHGPINDGALPACALLLILFGFALLFPTLLQDGTSAASGAANVSTMRLAVLMIVSVFTLVVVKAGWGSTLADLKIDSSWAWVLAAAFGGKAAQSFAENPPK